MTFELVTVYTVVLTHIKDKTVGQLFSYVVCFPSVDEELSRLRTNVSQSFSNFPHPVSGIFEQPLHCTSGKLVVLLVSFILM